MKNKKLVSIITILLFAFAGIVSAAPNDRMGRESNDFGKKSCSPGEHHSREKTHFRKPKSNEKNRGETHHRSDRKQRK